MTLKRKLLFLLLSYSFLNAQTLPKFGLKGNGDMVYPLEKSVDSFDAMFNQGTFYGRLRTNNFYYIDEKEDAKNQTHFISGVGGSVVFHSASFNGFGVRLGGYGSQAFFNESMVKNISIIKSGDDTLNRFEYANTGSTSLFFLGQANIHYTFSKTNFTLGRQIIEGFYTKSNDSKMIPNTFDGLSLYSKELPKTTLQFAFFTKQKLRDHQDSHSVLMYGDSNFTDAKVAKWSQNDDSAMHRGLTYTALKNLNKPTASPLIVLDVKNNTISNLKVNMASYIVPQLLWQVMGEAYYKVPFDAFSVTTGFRYLQQFDQGAGEVGGASLSTKGLDGYKDALSLNAKMVAGRVDIKVADYRLRVASTYILDEADLVAPWRAFPTSSYTRSMGIYNWKANTKSYRIELVKNANAKGVYLTPFIQTSVLYINGDQSKKESDSLYYYYGMLHNLPFMPQLSYKIRFGYRQFVGDSSSISNYLDSRLELNYLF